MKSAVTGLCALALAMIAAPALAQTPAPSAPPLIVEKRAFEMPSYTTLGGQTIRNVRVGWQSAGTLNADRSNVILITHFFSATSHAFGRYRPEDQAPGYWDAIIGPGKAIDTNRWFVISSDTLVNLNTGNPTVITTGPASVNPDTGKPWGMSFPIVTIGDFVNVQKALLESLGIRRIHTVMGASMGALQAYDWAARHPEMVGRIIPVIGSAEANPWLIAWMDAWASPIRLDPKWNGGDYYGKEPPLEGLAQSLKLVTLHAQHWDWAQASFGRSFAEGGKDPLAAHANRYRVETFLNTAGMARARTSDANHFLYLAKANQTFAPGGAQTLDEPRRRSRRRPCCSTRRATRSSRPSGSRRRRPR